MGINYCSRVVISGKAKARPATAAALRKMLWRGPPMTGSNGPLRKGLRGGCMKIIRCAKIYPILRKLQSEFGWDDYGYTFSLNKYWAELFDQEAFVCEGSANKYFFFSEISRLQLDGKNPIARIALKSDLPQTFIYKDVPHTNTPKERQLFDLIDELNWKSGVAIPVHAYGGALGIVTFNSCKEHVPAKVVQGTISYLTPWLFQFNAWARQLLEKHQFNETLSKREIECMQLVSGGMTSKEIAEILAIKKRTVDFHVSNATKKLKSTNRVHAASVLSTMQVIRPGSGFSSQGLSGA